MKDFLWVKSFFKQFKSKGFEIEFRSFKDGDFGDLDRNEFKGNSKDGGFDIWSSG